METKPGDLEGLAAASGKAIQNASKSLNEEATSSHDAFPDPDEDDLDDLDGWTSSNKLPYTRAIADRCRYAR